MSTEARVWRPLTDDQLSPGQERPGERTSRRASRERAARLGCEWEVVCAPQNREKRRDLAEFSVLVWISGECQHWLERDGVFIIPRVLTWVPRPFKC